jgi:hypothetical protein
MAWAPKSVALLLATSILGLPAAAPPSAISALQRGDEWSGDKAGDGFGWALAALSEERLAVAAPHPGGDAPGRVTVFARGRSQALFTCSGERPGDQFGYALLSGFDWNRDGHGDLAIGAPGDSSDGLQGGSVRIHCGFSGLELDRIQSSRSGSRFGAALALLPSDATPRGHVLVVGAPGEEGGQGAIRLFEVGTGAPLSSAVGHDLGSEFGAAIAVVGDLTADGHMDLVVGAPGDARRGPSAGAAVVIAGRTLRPVATQLGRAPKERFGESVAALGIAGSRGRVGFAVAAPSAMGVAEQRSGGRVREVELVEAGRVDTFVGPDREPHGSLWGEDAGEFLGRALIGGFDWDGDSQPDLAVGTPYASLSIGGSRRTSGVVRIVSGRTHEVIAELRPRGADEHFGAALALLVDGGEPRLAIGLPRRGATDPPEQIARAGGVRVVALPRGATATYLPRPRALQDGPELPPLPPEPR